VFLSRLRSRGVLLAATPVLAMGLAGAGAVTAARADPAAAGASAGPVVHPAPGPGPAERRASGSARVPAAPSVLGDWNGDGRADIMARDPAGQLWLYPGTSQRATPYHARRQIGTGWQIYSALVRHGDWNVDGKQDLLARDAQGVLWYYQATGAATGPGHYARARVGGGWQVYRHLVGVDDWTGDGLDDLVAVDTAGKLWLYAGKGAGANFFQPRREIGHGWQIYDLLAADGDLTYDNAAELTARDRDGLIWFYDSTGDPAKPYGTRYPADPPVDRGDITVLAGVGDLDGGGLPDLLVRRYDGTLWLGSPEAPEFADSVGRGWNIYDALL
jgi:hypothetical protein